MFFLPLYSAGKKLTMILDNYPLNLDPRVGTDQASQRIQQIIFNGLFKKTKNFGVEKDVLKDYKILSLLKIEFYLKKGIFFHNGKELTSRDILWTFNSMLSKDFKSIRKAAFKSIKKIYAKGRYGFIIELKYPDSALFYNLVIGIVPYGSNQDFFRNPVGTGPFIYKKSEKNILYFKANKRYFKHPPFIDNLIIKVIDDPISRILILKKGKADFMINSVPPEFIKSLKGTKNYVIDNYPGNTMYYLGFNLKDKLLKNKDFREALSYAVNYKELMKFVMKGFARRAYTLLSPEHWAYSDKIKKYYYSLKKAKEKLKNSKIKNPEIEIKCANKEVSRKIAIALKYYWGLIGVKVKIKTLEFSSFYKDIISGNFQIYPLAWVGILSPDIYKYTLHSKFIPPNGANRAHYINRVIDVLLDNAEKTYDLKIQEKIYEKVEKIISEDIPFIPLWYSDNIIIYKKGITDINRYPSGEYYFLERIKKR
jgi:peptide/nickel transport system substrate-binding protein